MRRTKEAAEESKKVILSAAYKIFLEKGYAATNLDEIAREINMTRGVIYWHFKNKLDLFVCLLNEELDQSILKGQEIFQSSDESLRNKFKRLLRGDVIGSRWIELIKAFHPGTKELNYKQFEETFKPIAEKVGKALGFFTQFIIQEQIDGHIRKDIDGKAFAAAMIMAIGILHAPPAKRDMIPFFSVRDSKRDQIIDFFWNGMNSVLEDDSGE
jgi:AcrR family transcriptional regulator